jgi:DNA-binding response OmpR family regulator
MLAATDRDPKIILMMDNGADEAQALHILKKYHFANGVEVIRSAAKAIQRLSPALVPPEGGRDVLPALIILSIGSPTARLIDLAKLARSNPYFTPVPLIILVNCPEEESEFRAANIPGCHCLAKPLGFFKLLEAMQKLGSRWLVMNPGGD